VAVRRQAAHSREQKRNGDGHPAPDAGHAEAGETHGELSNRVLAALDGARREKNAVALLALARLRCREAFANLERHLGACRRDDLRLRDALGKADGKGLLAFGLFRELKAKAHALLARREGAAERCTTALERLETRV